MNYINRPKECYTQEEWIKYLEESIRELRIEKDRIRKEKWEIRKKMLELERDLEHRDSVLSIMYDLLRSDLWDYDILCMIDAVIISECWDELTTNDRELVDKFWKRDFRS